MLREQASKLLQQAKIRQSDLAKRKQNPIDQQSQTADDESQSNGGAATSEQRKYSLPTDLKTAPFTLVKKKQLKQLSPRHFLKEKKPSESSCKLSFSLRQQCHYFQETFPNAQTLNQCVPLNPFSFLLLLDVLSPLAYVFAFVLIFLSLTFCLLFSCFPFPFWMSIRATCPARFSC